MNKNIFIIITILLVGVFATIFVGGSKINKNSSFAKIEIKNGVQYIFIDAGGGYFPKVSSAKAGMPTKLVMKTSGTYDCSASLVIPSIGYQKILPKTGETEIDIGIKNVGEKLDGVCGMGMYSFTINFS